jgi:putative SOS response-associated peptidase YedK
VTPRWGLVPSWSKDASGGARMINARLRDRGEQAGVRGALRPAPLPHPADGYYEWTPQTENGRNRTSSPGSCILRAGAS